ncbi:MAG: hypothetical protein ACON5B_02715, partial [Myxococcota bacterium]
MGSGRKTRSEDAPTTVPAFTDEAPMQTPMATAVASPAETTGSASSAPAAIGGFDPFAATQDAFDTAIRGGTAPQSGTRMPRPSSPRSASRKAASVAPTPSAAEQRQAKADQRFMELLGLLDQLKAKRKAVRQSWHEAHSLNEKSSSFQRMYADIKGNKEIIESAHDGVVRALRTYGRDGGGGAAPGTDPAVFNDTLQRAHHGLNTRTERLDSLEMPRRIQGYHQTGLEHVVGAVGDLASDPMSAGTLGVNGIFAQASGLVGSLPIIGKFHQKHIEPLVKEAMVNGSGLPKDEANALWGINNAGGALAGTYLQGRAFMGKNPDFKAARDGLTVAQSVDGALYGAHDAATGKEYVSEKELNGVDRVIAGVSAVGGAARAINTVRDAKTAAQAAKSGSDAKTWANMTTQQRANASSTEKALRTADTARDWAGAAKELRSIAADDATPMD